LSELAEALAFDYHKSASVTKPRNAEEIDSKNSYCEWSIHMDVGMNAHSYPYIAKWGRRS